MMDVNVDLLQCTYLNFFDKKYSGGTVKSEIYLKVNYFYKELAEELHKPIIRKFDKRKVHSSLIDNILGADLVDMLHSYGYELISKCSKEFRLFLCVIYIYSNYAWVLPLTDKKGITIANAFQKLSDESNRKLNKIWVDIDSEIYNRSMKSWLENNKAQMYSTHNEGTYVVAGKFIRALKSKLINT